MSALLKNVDECHGSLLPGAKNRMSTTCTTDFMSVYRLETRTFSRYVSTLLVRTVKNLKFKTFLTQKPLEIDQKFQ
jgi:hypothetical protein